MFSDRIRPLFSQPTHQHHAWNERSELRTFSFYVTRWSTWQSWEHCLQVGEPRPALQLLSPHGFHWVAGSISRLGSLSWVNTARVAATITLCAPLCIGCFSSLSLSLSLSVSLSLSLCLSTSKRTCEGQAPRLYQFQIPNVNARFDLLHPTTYRIHRDRNAKQPSSISF